MLFWSSCCLDTSTGSSGDADLFVDSGNAAEEEDEELEGVCGGEFVEEEIVFRRSSNCSNKKFELNSSFAEV